MDSFFDKILSYANKHHLLAQNNTIIIGFSGGPDSRALVEFFYTIRQEYNLTLICVYVDHHWRAESAQEALWCAQVCKQYAIDYQSISINRVIEHIKNRGSLEDQARSARRLIFESVAQQYKAHAIALGHHSNDQIETFFIRLIRGAHLEGLKAMQPHHGLYIRPFLETTKQEIIEYLAARNITYCNDHSNDDTSFLRNRLRHHLIDQAHSIDQRFSNNCLRSINALGQAHEYVQHHLKQEWELIIDIQSCSLNLSLWRTLHSFAQRAHLIKFLIHAKVNFRLSEAFIVEIERFINNKKSKEHLIGSCILFKNKNHLGIRH